MAQEVAAREREPGVFLSAGPASYSVPVHAAALGGTVGLLIGGGDCAGGADTRLWYTSARYLLYRLLGHRGVIPVGDDHSGPAALTAGNVGTSSTTSKKTMAFEPFAGLPELQSLPGWAADASVDALSELRESHALDALGVTHILIDELHERHFDAEILLIVVRRLALADARRRLRDIRRSLDDSLCLFAEKWDAATPADTDPMRILPAPFQLDPTRDDLDATAAISCLVRAVQFWAARPRVVLLSATYDEQKLRDFLLVPLLDLLKGFWASLSSASPATVRFFTQWSVGGLASAAGLTTSDNAFERDLRVTDLFMFPLCNSTEGPQTLLCRQAVRAAREPVVEAVMVDDLVRAADADALLANALNRSVDGSSGFKHAQSIASACGQLCDEWDKAGGSLTGRAVSSVRLKFVDRDPQIKRSVTALAAAIARGRAVCAFPHLHPTYDPKVSISQGDAVLVFCATAADIDGIYHQLCSGIQRELSPLFIDGDALCRALCERAAGNRRGATLGLCDSESLQSAVRIPKSADPAALSSAVKEALASLPAAPIELHDMQFRRLCAEVFRVALARLPHNTPVSTRTLTRIACDAATETVTRLPTLVLVKLYQSSPALAALDILEETRKAVAAARHEPHLLRNASFIFLATAVAETSLTLDRVHTVVDTGVYRDASGFPPGYGGSTLDQLWVSSATAKQRRGRAGRTAPPYAGFSHVAYCLYTARLIKRVGQHPPAALLQYPSKSLVLRLKALVQQFPDMVWESPDWQQLRRRKPLSHAASVSLLELLRNTQDPDTADTLFDSFRAAFADLYAMGALTAPVDGPSTTATWMGQFLSDLPAAVGPEAGLFVLAGLRLGSLPEAIVMAAACAMLALGSRMHKEKWTDPFDTELRKAHCFWLLGRENGLTAASSAGSADPNLLVWSEHIYALRLYLLFRHLRYWYPSDVSYKVFKGLGVEPSFLTDVHALVVPLCEKLIRMSVSSRVAEILRNSVLESGLWNTDREAWRRGVNAGKLWPGSVIFTASTDALRRLVAAAGAHAVAVARVVDPLGAESWRRIIQHEGIEGFDPVRSLCLATSRTPVDWTVSHAMHSPGDGAFCALAGKPLFASLARAGILCDPGGSNASGASTPCVGMAALAGDAVTVSVDAADSVIGLLAVPGSIAPDNHNRARSLASWLFEEATKRRRSRREEPELLVESALLLPKRLVVQLCGFCDIPITCDGVGSTRIDVAAPPSALLAMLACVNGIKLDTGKRPTALSEAVPAAPPSPGDATLAFPDEEAAAADDDDCGADAVNASDIEERVFDMQSAERLAAGLLFSCASEAVTWSSDGDSETGAASAAEASTSEPRPPWLAAALVTALASLPGPVSAKRAVAAGLPLSAPFLAELIPGTVPPQPLSPPAPSHAPPAPSTVQVRAFHPDELAWGFRPAAGVSGLFGPPTRCFPHLSAFSHARARNGPLAVERLYSTVTVPLLVPDRRRGGAAPALKLCGMSLLWQDPRAVMLSLVALRPCSELRISWAPPPPPDDALAVPAASAEGASRASFCHRRRLRDLRVEAATFDPGTLGEFCISLPAPLLVPLPRLLFALRVRRRLLALTHALSRSLQLSVGVQKSSHSTGGEPPELSSSGDTELRALVDGAVLNELDDLPPVLLPLRVASAEAPHSSISLSVVDGAWACDSAPPRVWSAAEDVAALCGIPPTPFPGAFADDDPLFEPRGADVVLVVASDRGPREVSLAVAAAVDSLGSGDRVCLITADAPRRRMPLVCATTANKALLQWHVGRLPGAALGQAAATERVAGALRLSAGVLDDRLCPNASALVIVLCAGALPERGSRSQRPAAVVAAVTSGSDSDPSAALLEAARSCCFGWPACNRSGESSGPSSRTLPRARLSSATLGIGGVIAYGDSGAAAAPLIVSALRRAAAACDGVFKDCGSASQLPGFFCEALAARPLRLPPAAACGPGTGADAIEFDAALRAAFPPDALTSAAPGPRNDGAFEAACAAFDETLRAAASTPRPPRSAEVMRSNSARAHKPDQMDGFRMARGPPADGFPKFDSARCIARELKRQGALPAAADSVDLTAPATLSRSAPERASFHRATVESRPAAQTPVPPSESDRGRPAPYVPPHKRIAKR